MKKPNILLVVTDQHRLSALKAYDQDSVCKTPHMDKLAEEGVLFENAYTTCPVCTPARALATLFIGLKPDILVIDFASIQVQV